MSSRLMQRNADYIRVLARASPRKRKQILHKAPKELIYALSEGAHNILNGNVRLTPVKYQQLKRYKTSLRVLANKKSALKRKRATIQRGGFLGALASVLVPTIASLFGGLGGN